MTQADKIPQEIRLQKERHVLTLVYVDGAKSLPAEYLRVYSPSAEVRGHGAGQDVLQTGKAEVSITDLDPVGQYALKITFQTATTAAFMIGTISTDWRTIKTRFGKTISTASRKQAHLERQVPKI